MLSQAELTFLTLVPRELTRIADALEKGNDLVEDAIRNADNQTKLEEQS